MLIFVQRFVHEMKTIFPDKYWFLGADEVTGKQWEENKSLDFLIKEFTKTKKAVFKSTKID